MSFNLFFEDEFNFTFNAIKRVVISGDNYEDRLKVAIAADIFSFSPTIYESNSRGISMNIYESLVRPNKFLQLQPQLALSWGLREDGLTWDFKLRGDVKFHDGSLFDADDVIASIKLASESEGSQVKTLLTNIDSYQKIDDKLIRIKTKTPDVVFPRKIGVVLIFPSEKVSEINAGNPIGTGPYKFYKHTKGQSIALEVNENYWGIQPKYKNVIFYILKDKFDRLNALKGGVIDILLNVPPSYTQEIEQAGYEVKVRPGLETNFLFFNFNDSDIQNKNVRIAISHIIDKKSLSNLGESFLKPIYQFVPTGILGYNADISGYEFDKLLAQSLARDNLQKGRKMNLVLSDRMLLFGNELKKNFALIGIELNIVSVPDNQLIDEIKKGESQLYFIGWRFELGDVGDFLGEVIHSRDDFAKWGKLNFTGFKDNELDRLIEESFSTLDFNKRTGLLKHIMAKIVEDYVLGIPLFESKIIYAHAPRIKWEPRMDTYFLASEVK